MAKKKDDVEIDLGHDLEGFDSEFDDLNFDAFGDTNTTSNRTPVEKVKVGVTSGFHSTRKNLGPVLKQRLAHELPHTAGFISEATTFKSNASTLKREFMQDIQPNINQFKQAGRTLNNKFKNYIPNKLQQKLDKVFAESETWSNPSVEANRTLAINDQLSTIFAAQEKREQAKLEEDSADKFADRALASTHHKQLTSIVDAIRISSEFQQHYTQTIGTAYLKKSLELKYKHLFVAQDTLSVVQGLAKVLEKKLEDIRHNTALPDTQKQQLTESYKEVAKAAMAQRINNRFADWGSTVLKNVETSILNPAKFFLSTAGMGAEMYSNMAPMMDMGEDNSLEYQTGSHIGEHLAGRIGKKIGNKLFGEGGLARGLISPYAKNLEESMSSLKMRLMLKAQALGEEDDGSLMSSIFKILSPGLRSGAGNITNDLSDPFAPTHYDKAARTSLVEIIPGYLSRILQQTTKLATGKDVPELVFDYNKRDFVSSSDFKRSVITEAFGTQKTLSRDLGDAVGSLRGSFAHLHDDLPTFDDNVDSIKKLFINAISIPDVLHPERIKEFVENTHDENRLTSKYISKLFDGIDNPREVATLLLSILYRTDDQINTQALNQVNNYIIGLMSKDAYLQILPKYALATGQSRYLKDIMTTHKSEFRINDKFVKQNWLNNDNDSFDSGVNSTTGYIKSRLDQDVDAKRESASWVQDLFEIFSGDALSNNKQKRAEDSSGSSFDDFFKNIFTANNLRDNELNKFKSSKLPTDKTRQAVPMSLSTVIPGHIRQLTVDELESHDIDRTIISGSEIVVPVHLKTSDVKFQLDAPKEKVVPQTQLTQATTVSATDAILQAHADRQYPVPDLLERLASSNSEMNDKLLSVMAGSGHILGKIQHNGKTIRAGVMNAFVRFKTDILIPGLKSAKAAGEYGQDLATTGLVKLGFLGADLYESLQAKLPKLRSDLAAAFANFNEYKESLKDNLTLSFVDIYLKDEVEPGNPLLSKRQQRKGVVFSDGQRVLTSYSIDKPVLDQATGDTYITQENIEHGLVDVYNKPLKTTLGFKSPFGKSKLGGWVDRLSGLKDMFSKDGKFGGLFGGGLDRIKDLMDRLKIRNPFGGGDSNDETKNLKIQVGDKLDEILQYLKSRFGEAGSDLNPQQPGSGPMALGTGYDHYQETLAEDAAQAAEEQAKATETQTDILRSIRDIEEDNLAANREQAEKSGEGGGGFMNTILTMLGGGKLMSIAKTALGGAGIGGAILGAGKALGGLFGMGGGTAGAVTAGTVAAETAAVTGGAVTTGTGLTLAGAGAAAGKFILGSIAASPIGWGVAGAVALGATAYLGYKWLNPSSDDLDKLRAEYYGIDLETDTGFFESSYTKRLFNLEEVTAEMLTRTSATFTDDDLVYWAEKFGFNPKVKDQVKYWTAWYRQRFYPVFRIFVDLVKKCGFTYDNMDDMPTEAREALMAEFTKQVEPHVGKYKDLVPTEVGFKKFKKIYDEQLQNHQTKPALDAAATKARQDEQGAHTATTANAKAFKPGYDETRAIETMAKESEASRSGVGATIVGVTTPAAMAAARANSPFNYTGGDSTRSTIPLTPGGPSGPIVPVDVSGYKPKLPDSDELGALSAKYESSKAGSVAIGYDGHGGTSYGTYQIASKTGTFSNFLSWLTRQGPEGKEVATRLASAGNPNTGSKQGAVPEEWKRLVVEGKMKDFEHDFIKETHYDQALRTMGNPDIVNMVNSSKALQDVLWSTAVQHGPGGAVTIFSRAWASTSDNTPETFIKYIYALRGNNFPSSTPKVQASVRSRFKDEASVALVMISKDKTSPDGETADGRDVASAVPDADTAPFDPKMVATASATSTPAANSGPQMVRNAGSGMDMAPASVATTVATPTSSKITAPVSTAAYTPAAGASMDSGTSALSELQKINAGIAQTNTHLQAILAGQGALIDIRDGIVNMKSGEVQPTNVSMNSEKNRNPAKSPRAMDAINRPPVSVDVSRPRMSNI